MTIYKEHYLIPENLHHLIGQNIRKLRLQKKYSQTQLGELSDMDQKQISKIESGRVQAKLSTYLRIANVLGVSIDHFLADALLIEPEHLPAARLSGKPEQRFLHETISAVLHYLQEKET